jgi:hypothetical protein
MLKRYMEEERMRMSLKVTSSDGEEKKNTEGEKMAKSGSPILTSSWLAVPLSCCIVALVMVAVAQIPSCFLDDCC